MKFYDERQMGGIRKVLEGTVLGWPGVSTREMMGCLTYFYGTKFFAFLVTKGIVITKLSKEDRDNLPKGMRVEPFKMAGRTVATWVRVPLRKSEDVPSVLPIVRKSYESAVASKK